MGDRLGETIRIATSGPVIIDFASFWYSITGWEETLLMRYDSAPNLRSIDLREGELIIKVSVHSAVNWVPVWPGVLELKSHKII